MECLALLSKRLVAPVPVKGDAAGGQQQQQQEPAYAAVSRWALEALQQEEPEVKSVPLVRGLLELFIRYHGEESRQGCMRPAAHLHTMVCMLVLSTCCRAATIVCPDAALLDESQRLPLECVCGRISVMFPPCVPCDQ